MSWAGAGKAAPAIFGLYLAGSPALAEADGELEVHDLAPMVVQGERFSRVDDFSVVSVDYMDETDLRRLAQSTLGETLAWQPGVTSSYFSPGASRPVIRGLEGFRVRMLRDGVGTLDVSDTSPDHGVALDPLLVREIDIHRGPSALLFGNSAIGGAVNAQTRSIPSELPQSMVSGAVESRYETVGDGTSVAGYTHLTFDELVFTVTGASRDSDDYDIPGRARTGAYDETYNPQVTPIGEFVSVPVPNPEGTLPNTFHESDAWSAGAAWLSQAYPLSIGGAYSRFDSEYGIPYQYGDGPNDLFGFSSLSLEQERFDVDARVDPGLGWFDALHFHLAYADYNHVESFKSQRRNSDLAFEDTKFDQHALEARLEWFHRPADWWEGVAGIQGQHQDLAVSYLQRAPLESTRIRRSYESGTLGFFALETLTLGDFSFQLGGRYEIKDIADVTLKDRGFERDNDEESYSVSGSVTWRRKELGPFDEIAITPSVSYVERIPTVIERYARWPNPAIQRFIVGDESLRKEESLGGELGVEARAGDWSGRLNAFYYDFDNFVFLQDVRGLGNRARFVEREAMFYGFEAEVRWARQLGMDGTRVTVSLMSDSVRGHNESDGQPLPRMPPVRIGSRVELEWRALMAGIEYRYAFSHDRVQPATDVVLVELPTDSYAELNFDASYEFTVVGANLTAFLRATNLLDEERRLHTSFLKDVAPLPGRSVSLGARVSF
jgi:iron complex outermembrane receptor protein